jgi:hypothetical protein
MITNVREFLQARYGVPLVSRESAAGSTAGLASAQLMRQDGRRLGFTYYNLSAGDWHYVRPSGLPVTATFGFAAGPGGGGVNFSALDDGEMVSYEWQVISTGALSPYYFVETLLEVLPGA